MLNKGKIFVFEGPDGVGKTELSIRVIKNLNNNYTTKYFSFPGKEESTLGNLVYQLHHNPDQFNIKSVDQNSLQLLHVASHIDTINNKLLPMLNKGHIIILDRYWWSTYAYGSVLGANKSALTLMIETEKIFWQNVQPDIIFYIKRKKSSLLHSDLEKTYEEIISTEIAHQEISAIDNNGSIDSSLNQILKEIYAKLDNLEKT